MGTWYKEETMTTETTPIGAGRNRADLSTQNKEENSNARAPQLL
jgi:hypothetical protein